MTTKRYFSGTRSGSTGQMGEAAKLKRMEMMRGGKLPLTGADRYKMLMEKKLDDHRAKAVQNPRTTFMLPGARAGDKQLSKSAEMALKEVARRKAAKEEKKMRQMVVIKPREYSDNLGFFARIDKRGNIYDHVGNLVLKVDAKKGKVKTMGGMVLGKYNPKGGMAHVTWMREWINKNSPYHIRLRQLELQRQMQLMYDMNGTQALNIMPQSIYGGSHEGDGSASGQRNNLGVGAWGVMSNNVHGTFGDNVYGTFSDNVWGTAYSNIWGGIGDGASLYGKGRNIWNSGRPGQKNYIAAGFSILAAMLGLSRGDRGAVRNNPSAAAAPARGRR